jgi:uncharacterized membrane protein YoaK (UPF0700 family)
VCSDRVQTIHHPMRRLKLITYRHRSHTTNWTLGVFLAFNAGAVNAGGFLVLHTYTSHMTGFASQLADSAVLGNGELFLSALGAIMSFVLGAATCALLVNWARQMHLRAIYAPALLLEAALMLPFGLMGALTLTWPTPFAVPVTVLLLSFIMGLQNAVGSKTSGGSIRTTHMTGNITDVGMEFGKLLYWNARSSSSAGGVRHDKVRLKRSAGLVAMFVLGGVVGALGFKHLGFICVIPLASLLIVLSVPPLMREIPRLTACRRGLRSLGEL